VCGGVLYKERGKKVYGAAKIPVWCGEVGCVVLSGGVFCAFRLSVLWEKPVCGCEIGVRTEILHFSFFILHIKFVPLQIIQRTDGRKMYI
jgi:hypothetical protein